MKFLNDNASAIGIIFAVLSGATVIVTFIWKMAIRYQKIEDKLESLEASIDDKFENKFTILQEWLELKVDDLKSKLDTATMQINETADDVKDTSTEIKDLKEKLNASVTKIAVIESRLEHKL